MVASQKGWRPQAKSQFPKLNQLSLKQISSECLMSGLENLLGLCDGWYIGLVKYKSIY
jgi:hypothetical protein